MENATENTAVAETTEAQTTEETTAETKATEKTFTQAELDRIVQERVREERAKLDEYKTKAAKYDEMEANSKAELQKAQEKADKLTKELADLKHGNEIREMKERVAKEKGVPADLLTGETTEACEAQAEAILNFAGGNGLLAVRDGGESNPATKKSTAKQFGEWIKEQI